MTKSRLNQRLQTQKQKQCQWNDKAKVVRIILMKLVLSKGDLETKIYTIKEIEDLKING